MRAYRGLSVLGRTLALRVMRWEVHGLDHLPRSGPAILACNHVSYIDPPLIGALVPRHVYFMAKDEVFAVPLLGAFLRAIGTFPVRRDRPDVAAVRRALRVLERGDVLGIFPEGTRNRTSDLRTPQEFRAGVGWLAIRTGAPVLPVAIDGYVPLGWNADWTRPTRLRVTCGPPMYFGADTFPSTAKPYRAEAARRVREAVQRLLVPGAAGAAGASRAEEAGLG